MKELFLVKLEGFWVSSEFKIKNFMRNFEDIISQNTYRQLLPHCVKSVQTQSFFCSLFSCIRTKFNPNTGKDGPEKTPYLDIFYAVSSLSVLGSNLKHWFYKYFDFTTV